MTEAKTTPMDTFLDTVQAHPGLTARALGEIMFPDVDPGPAAARVRRLAKKAMADGLVRDYADCRCNRCHGKDSQTCDKCKGAGTLRVALSTPASYVITTLPIPQGPLDTDMGDGLKLTPWEGPLVTPEDEGWKRDPRNRLAPWARRLWKDEAGNTRRALFVIRDIQGKDKPVQYQWTYWDRDGLMVARKVVSQLDDAIASAEAAMWEDEADQRETILYREAPVPEDARWHWYATAKSPRAVRHITGVLKGKGFLRPSGMTQRRKTYRVRPSRQVDGHQDIQVRIHPMRKRGRKGKKA